MTDMSTRADIPERFVADWQQAIGGPSPLLALAATRALRDRLADTERSLVAEALSEGASWEDVAAALGVSRQAAWRKFAKREERRRERRARLSPEEAELRRRQRAERRELRERQRRELRDASSRRDPDR